MIVYHVMIPDNSQHAKSLKRLGYMRYKRVKYGEARFTLYIKEAGDISFNNDIKMNCVNTPTYIKGWLAVSDNKLL